LVISLKRKKKLTAREFGLAEKEEIDRKANKVFKSKKDSKKAAEKPKVKRKSIKG
jgi:hypothetical protein